MAEEIKFFSCQTKVIKIPAMQHSKYSMICRGDSAIAAAVQIKSKAGLKVRQEIQCQRRPAFPDGLIRGQIIRLVNNSINQRADAFYFNPDGLPRLHIAARSHFYPDAAGCAGGNNIARFQGHCLR